MKKCSLVFNLLLLPATQAFHVISRLPAAAVATPRQNAPGWNKSDIGRKRYPMTLQMSEDPLPDEAKDTNNKLIKRKKRVVMGYKAASFNYLILVLCTYTAAAAPPGSAVGPLLAAGLAHILHGAAAADRLGSDTYKRLTLVLTKYSLAGLVVSVILRAPVRFKPLFISSSLVATINGIKGYGYGAKGWELKGGASAVTNDLKHLIKSSIKTLCSLPKNVKSAGYLAITALLTSLTLAKLWNVAKLLLGEPASSAVIGTSVMRLVRLNVMAVVSLVLKDAADRDRLEGTTFIQLNMLLSFAFFMACTYSIFSFSCSCSRLRCMLMRA